jgi:hypothetical protein
MTGVMRAVLGVMAEAVGVMQAVLGVMAVTLGVMHAAVGVMAVALGVMSAAMVAAALRHPYGQNAPVSATLAKRPLGFLYSFTAPVCVSVTVRVYSTFDSAP